MTPDHVHASKLKSRLYIQYPLNFTVNLQWYKTLSLNQGKNRLFSKLALFEKIEFFWIDPKPIFEDNVGTHG